MLSLLVPIFVALAAPSPVSTASAPPAPSALREIGHVESLSICSAIVVHANSAISAALDNDSDLALVINRLRTTDLDDDNEIKRRNGMNDLATLTGRIRGSAAGGSAEVKRLRAITDQTTDPKRKAELKAFTDALGGAIARQRKAAVDLDKTLTVIDGRRAVEEVDTQEQVEQRASVGSDPTHIDPARPSVMPEPGAIRNPAAPTTPSRVDDVLRSMADDFQLRTQAILADEGVAADHSLSATTGC
jgi:hypothetical protein